MFESFRRKKVEAHPANAREELSTRIAELEAHIQTGNHTADDAKILEQLKKQLENTGG